MNKVDQKDFTNKLRDLIEIKFELNKNENEKDRNQSFKYYLDKDPAKVNDIKSK